MVTTQIQRGEGT